MPTEKALAEQNSIDTVWSGTVRSAMIHLDPAQVETIEAAADALAAPDHVRRDEQRSGPRS